MAVIDGKWLNVYILAGVDVRWSSVEVLAEAD
jgi:hypothetical protein